MIMKFKPVYNFQSVEFEMEVNGPADLSNAFKWYKQILIELQKVAPEQPAPVKQVAPKEAMATDKQISTLVKLGIDEEEAKKMTTKQAYNKIKELIEK